MEKECNICKNIFETKNKKQKTCSVKCQYESYRVKKVERVNTNCTLCGCEFSILPNKLENGKGKYCSRECKDKHQKIIYLGTNNPTYGLKQSEEQKRKTSIRSKKLWETQEYRNKIKDGINNFIEINGFYPGSDNQTIEKRRKTMFERYGVKHNWVGKYGERKCDLTTIEIYGKTSTDMLAEYSHYYGKKTNIESIFEQILQELNVPYQFKFRIYDKQKINFWYKEYDFLLLDTNILIEVDGDYWHGNENKFTELSEFQKQVKNNDLIKQEFAKSKGFDVLRFWEENIIKDKEQVKQQIQEICQKLK